MRSLTKFLEISNVYTEQNNIIIKENFLIIFWSIILFVKKSKIKNKDKEFNLNKNILII